MYTKRNGGGLF